MFRAPQICPSCYSHAPPDAATCPACGMEFARWAELDYADRLIASLRHPLSDVRMTAIAVLALRRESRAATPLRDLAFAHPVDVVQDLSIVEALAEISGEVSVAALTELARGHPARAVRKAALHQLERPRGGADDFDELPIQE